MSATLFARLGLAVTNPRAALELAGRRESAGRSGSDLLAAILILLLATQLRWLVQGAWLGFAVNATLGLNALVHVLTRTLTLELGTLVIAAALIFAASGRARELGRSFDLACVTVLPIVFVYLLAQTIIGIGDLPMPAALSSTVEVVSFGWAAGMVTLAVGTVRGAPAAIAIDRSARRAGWAIATIAFAGIAVQGLWVAEHADLVRPLQAGVAAPAFELPAIGAGGRLGPRVARTPGRVTIVDFWATWCGPCLHSMPHLDQIARQHPEIDVLTINLDDAAEARAIFDRAHYILALLADDGEVSERFGVVTIPHTVVIDRGGTLRRVGGNGDLEAEIKAAE
ncbi:MAG: redoxin domain-containing protein [Kofleriaceae bacterium]